ncbi:hypothetical protein CRE_21939 [Caenorhabditis remanei]|uniref:Uncharacterized protein n=1 Tax=Caenorhabditis remanei TaxID=31234 RepID=E3MUG4_CAERE|nr:hypothetical protein CRE_21939 [Caenorhabditis remanei]
MTIAQCSKKYQSEYDVIWKKQISA